MEVSSEHRLTDYRYSHDGKSVQIFSVEQQDGLDYFPLRRHHSKCNRLRRIHDRGKIPSFSTDCPALSKKDSKLRIPVHYQRCQYSTLYFDPLFQMRY